jgi:hypothetical protein
MGKSTKTQRLREKMRAAVRQSKQTTLDSLPEAPKKESVVESAPKKQIVLTEIDTLTREDELVLKVGLKLLPSNTAFSKINAELYFDEHKIESLHIRVLQGPLATDNLEFTSVLGMKGISAGSHVIKVEMYELWSSEEKLTCVSKEVTIEYVPVKREDRLIKVPIVKSVAGADLAVVSDLEKDIYREIEANMKKELKSERDEW